MLRELNMAQEELEILDACVAIDTPCIGCGYNVKTLAVSGNCPECGKSVAATWLKAAQIRGSTLDELPLTLRAVAWLAIANGLLTPAAAMAPIILNLAIVVASLTLFLLFLFELRVAHSIRREFAAIGDPGERGLRTAGLALVGAWLLWLAASPLAAIVQLIIVPVVLLPCWVGPRVRRVVYRVHRRSLHDRAHTQVMIALSTLVGLSISTLGNVLVFGWGIDGGHRSTVEAGVVAVHMVAGGLLLLANFNAIRLCFSVAKWMDAYRVPSVEESPV